ncbi:MAG TPA: hypothetical protein VHE36_02200 [Sphingomicrobium sp.]|jgi:hypothetical protein|nr:hypothetical protein [Sphingomicrobium sp.]
MAYSKADLELVERHVAQGEQHIIRQEELISRLRSRGLPTEEAEKLLKGFQESLHEHRAHRDRIAEALDDNED